MARRWTLACVEQVAELKAAHADLTAMAWATGRSRGECDMALWALSGGRTPQAALASLQPEPVRPEPVRGGGGGDPLYSPDVREGRVTDAARRGRGMDPIAVAIEGSQPWTNAERMSALADLAGGAFLYEVAERHGRTIIDAQLEFGVGPSATLRAWRANRQMADALQARERARV